VFGTREEEPLPHLETQGVSVQQHQRLAVAAPSEQDWMPFVRVKGMVRIQRIEA
jgi:hypothetical protein